MMTETRFSSLDARGLRTRYQPKSRIGQGLVGAAPWLNVLLLMMMFAMMERRVVLQPGVVVDLPAAPFRDGTPASGPVAVILSVPGLQPGAREDVVFFDDERFLLSSPRQADSLRRALAARARREAGAVLIIQADRRVPHGTILAIMDMATGAGLRRVNMATRPL